MYWICLECVGGFLGRWMDGEQLGWAGQGRMG